jgi:hypothetical protein
MDKLELDKLILDIKELKRSVRKANPFLRDIMALKAYAILSFPLGILLLADCLVTHFLIQRSGSFGAIPVSWKIASIAIFALTIVIGSVSKWIVIARRAAQVRDGANFFSVVKAIYGGHWFSLSSPLVLCMGATSLYFATTGHPWLIASFTAVFLGPFCNMVGKLLDREEYLYTGWYLILSGLASIFFMESAPFIWLAIVWAGTFLVFGAAGLAAGRADPAGRP